MHYSYLYTYIIIVIYTHICIILIIRTHTYIHAYISTYIHTYIYIRLYVYMFVRIYVIMYIHVYVCIGACRYAGENITGLLWGCTQDIGTYIRKCIQISKHTKHIITYVPLHKHKPHAYKRIFMHTYSSGGCQ